MQNRLFAIGLLIAVPSLTVAADKPRNREDAENRSENLERYKGGTFGEVAKATLGVKVIFQSQQTQGVTLSSFSVDSTAEKAGLRKYDWILEVDGSPVGKIRDRYYELFPHYGRTGRNKATLLVSYLDGSQRKFYYPRVDVTPVGGVPYCRILPKDFFTSSEPQKRESAESEFKNNARYVQGWGNFDKYAEFELGADVRYSSNGARIVRIKPDSAALSNGLRVGDIILEVEGAPVGRFGTRTYEVWRQYIYDRDGKVEFCIAIPSQGSYRYYYPEIKLKPRTTGG